MSQETYNLWSVLAQCGSVVVAVFVGGVIFWYTRETQKLREAAVEQVELTRRQLTLSVRPYLFTRIVEFIRYDLHQTAGANVNQTYRCSVWNATDRPAHNVNVLVRNRARGYFWTTEGTDLLTEMEPLKDGADLIARGPMPKADGLRSLRYEYGAEAEPYIDRLDQLPDDYSALFFRDINGHLYVALRTLDLSTEPPFLQQQNQIWDSSSPA